jgi:hypothetical protein
MLLLRIGPTEGMGTTSITTAGIATARVSTTVFARPPPVKITCARILANTVGAVGSVIAVVIYVIVADLECSRMDRRIVIVTIHRTTTTTLDTVTIAILIGTVGRTTNGIQISRIDSTVTVVIDAVTASLYCARVDRGVAIVAIDRTAGTAVYTESVAILIGTGCGDRTTDRVWIVCVNQAIAIVVDIVVTDFDRARIGVWIIVVEIRNTAITTFGKVTIVVRISTSQDGWRAEIRIVSVRICSYTCRIVMASRIAIDAAT